MRSLALPFFFFCYSCFFPSPPLPSHFVLLRAESQAFHSPLVRCPPVSLVLRCSGCGEVAQVWGMAAAWVERMACLESRDSAGSGGGRPSGGPSRLWRTQWILSQDLILTNNRSPHVFQDLFLTNRSSFSSLFFWQNTVYYT